MKPHLLYQATGLILVLPFALDMPDTTAWACLVVGALGLLLDRRAVSLALAVCLVALPATSRAADPCPTPPATDIPREVVSAVPGKDGKPDLTAPMLGPGIHLSLSRAAAMACAGETVVHQRDAATRDLAACRASSGGASYGTVVVVALASFLAGAIGGGYLVLRAVSK